MPSRNTYRLTWVFLTLDVGYLGCSSKAQLLLLTLDEGYLLMAAPPDLEHGATTPQKASVSSVQLLSHIQLFVTP